MAHRLLQDGQVQQDISADQLRQGDVVVVSAGEMIPADGEVVKGIASVDESAITANQRLSSEKRAATAVRSRAGRRCFPTVSS